MCFLLKCLVFVSVISIGYTARILGVFFCPSYSHQIVFHPVYRELSRRGHEVVVVTPNPLNDSSLTNLTEIDVSYLYKYQKHLYDGFFNSVTYSQMIRHGMNITNTFVEEILNNDEFKQIYQNAKREKFDLVMIESATTLVPAFGHLFNSPSIAIYSMEVAMDKYTTLGGILHPAVYGALFMDFVYPVSIWQKLRHVCIILWHKWYMKYINEPVVNQMTRKYFGYDFPPIAELEKNIDMLFVTKNRVMNSVRPTPPNIVELDFMHVREPQPLPKDLEEILNNSTQGAVYFSLGSNVKSSTLPTSVRSAIIEGLSSLPYTVLWKWESEEVPGVKDNVITRKWFPQQDVLAHLNVRVFVTQGGLQSSEEAIARAVPLVGIPVIVDQQDNVDKLVNLGVALQLSLHEFTSDSLKQAIIEVAENKKYSKNMKKIRDVSFDQPMTGLERAVWWSEYVIRNKGAPALRSAIADVPLYEYLLLDVIAVVLVGLVVSSFALKALVSALYSILSGVSKKAKRE